MKQLSKRSSDERARRLNFYLKVSADVDVDFNIYIKTYNAPQNVSEELSPVLVATVIPL